MEKLVVGLYDGRHQMPVDKYIFPDQFYAFDTDAVNKYVAEWVEENCGIHRTWSLGLNQADQNDVSVFTGNVELVVYVTGLTIATAAVIRACAFNGVSLTLMHYNPKNGQYYPQKIF